MSLGIVFKGPEGIVLASDSRVTLTAEIPGQKLMIPATYDNATKLLRVSGQEFVGAVTYGLGAIGQEVPRTAHSFLPEFEAQLITDKKQLGVHEFAARLGTFFLGQWKASMPSDFKGPPMVFLIGGFDEGAAYGRVFEVVIPNQPEPKEWHKDTFGATWGGQREFTDRLLQGYDPRLMGIINQLELSSEQIKNLNEKLKQLSVPIPYAFLPLQDCVDLSIFLVRTTMNMQRWQIAVRGVGGAIDVATITRTNGFQPVQEKKIRGESS